MKVVFAPDSFKGTLTAPEAAEAMRLGWATARPGDELRLCPMSDGGDGLIDVMSGLTGSEIRSTTVEGPLRDQVGARWVRRGEVAVIEMAEAAGIGLLAESELDPLHTSTFGVGQLMEAARSDGATEFWLGLGGSSTTDGGAGMLQALGVELFSVSGDRLIRPASDELGLVAEIHWNGAAAWRDENIRIISDVVEPLGRSAEVFGPQKGADPRQVAALTSALASWGELLSEGAGRDVAYGRGSGAAGGLGAALLAIGGEMADGARDVAELVGLDRALADADLVIVGEGQLDGTSVRGKVIGEVMRRAALRDVPVAAVVGRLREIPEGMLRVEEASPAGPTPNADRQVADAAGRLASWWGTAPGEQR